MAPGVREAVSLESRVTSVMPRDVNSGIVFLEQSKAKVDKRIIQTFT